MPHTISDGQVQAPGKELQCLAPLPQQVMKSVEFGICEGCELVGPGMDFFVISKRRERSRKQLAYAWKR